MDRRRFLQNATSYITLPFLLQGQVIRALAGTTGSNVVFNSGRILVLVQLDGGNDGLNTLIPLDMYSNLVKVRPNVVLPESSVLKLTDKQGLHPGMHKIKTLFDEEKVLFIQNVGYPQPNLSHFRSKEIILSASDSKTTITSGWFGRYLESLHPAYPADYPNPATPHPLSVTIGNSSSPTCQGELNQMGMVVPNLATTYQSDGGEITFPDSPYGKELAYISQVMKSTEKYLSVISEAASLSESRSLLWPAANSNKLADKLKVVARLICGGLNTPVYVVNLGGFDTHANQVVAGQTDTGVHANLLNYLSEAIFAFQDEITIHQRANDVLGLVYSEFGRRIASNKSNGTDHGEAYPMMLFGEQANPMVMGNNPEIDSESDPKANIPMVTDFRSVYASILYHWFNAEMTEINRVLNDQFTVLPILKSSVNAETDFNIASTVRIESVYPNPLGNIATIEFTSLGGHLAIQLVSASGKRIKSIVSAEFPKGKHNIQFQGSNLPAGNYVLVIQQRQMRNSFAVIKN